MAFLHYVLLATDGYRSPPSPRSYIRGYVGGLFRNDEGVVKEEWNWKDPLNRSYLQSKRGNARTPGPLLQAQVGDRVYISLINLGCGHPGPEFSCGFFLPGGLMSSTCGAPSLPVWKDERESPYAFTYYFTPEEPGTYLYYSPTQVLEDIQMGLYGVMIVYPSYGSLAKAGITKDRRSGGWSLHGVCQRQIPAHYTNRNFGYNNVASAFDTEYTFLLSEGDTAWREKVFAGMPYSCPYYQPDLFLLNGQTYPATLMPHPLGREYDSLVQLRTNQRVILRLANIGFWPVTWHVEGFDFMVLGKDARLHPLLYLASGLSAWGFPLGMGIFPLLRAVNVHLTCGACLDVLLTGRDRHPTYYSHFKEAQDGFSPLEEALLGLGMPDSTGEGEFFPMYNQYYPAGKMDRTRLQYTLIQYQG